MMISAEALLNIILLVALIIFMVTWIWQWKSNNSISCQIVQLFIKAGLTAIEIGLIAVRASSGENYTMNMVCAFIWLLNVVVSAFTLNDD